MIENRHDVEQAGRILRVLSSLSLCLPLVLTGCETVQDCSLTCKLWGNAEMRGFAEPADNPNLEIFVAPPKDVLVTYDEIREQNDHVCRRGFFLSQNLKRISRHQKPRFVNPETHPNL